VIFLTVGTQLPFDRLARAVDAWCARTGRGDEVFGQIGELGAGSYRPERFEWAEKIPPETFRAKVGAARLIVSHAGMGSIISAMQAGVPILVMPRRAHLGEHRNDHQQATVTRLAGRPGLIAARDEADLPDLLDRHAAPGAARDGTRLPPFADPALIAALRDFIHRS
jgi:UDP-N-acetylglucosamine transferase subunit ALG13